MASACGNGDPGGVVIDVVGGGVRGGEPRSRLGDWVASTDGKRDPGGIDSDIVRGGVSRAGSAENSIGVHPSISMSSSECRVD